jgi:CTP:molybdopterin cytidylyltransferase MocA
MMIHSLTQENPPVIILAAGLSERMGIQKPFLKWDGKISFLEKIISEYRFFHAKEMIVVLNFEGFRQLQKEIPGLENTLKIIINPNPEKGRMLSLKLGLKNLCESNCCFIQNTDNPFVDGFLLNSLNKIPAGDEYIIPVSNGKGGHPVLIGQKIINDILSVKENDFDLGKMLKNYKRREFHTKTRRSWRI